MLRNTFQAVIQMVRGEARLSTNTSRGIDHLDHIKQLIRRNVQQLAEDYEWQHLALKKESAVSRVVLQAGARTYAFPAAVNPAKIAQGWVKWGNLWQRVDYGITLDHFSALDPDMDQRSDPVRNWMFYSDIEFEVWPLPASNGAANGSGEFAFEGQRKPDTLLGDGDRVDMDDILVSLLSATEILAADNQKAAADVKGNAAAARLLQVRGNFGSKARYTIGLGKIGEAPYYPRHPTFIRKSS